MNNVKQDVKKIKTWLRTGLALALFLLPGSSQVRAIDLGLATRFSDVILENLAIGASYNLTAIKNLPMTIINNSTIDLDTMVEVEAPKPEEIKEGYEAIPDPNWIKVVPNRFTLQQGARNLSDILINIPNDPKLIGRHFQVMFWAHSMETGFLGVGVRVRLRFSVASASPESMKAEMIKKRMLDLNFRLEPISVTVADVELGKTVDLRADRKLPIKLVNTGASTLKLAMQSSPYVEPQLPPVGYEQLPEIKWMTVEPVQVKSDPDTIVPLKVKINIPNRPELRGRKFAGLLTVTVVGEAVPVNVYTQVLIHTLP